MIRRWRHRLRSRVVFLPVFMPGSTIVSSGLVSSKCKVRCLPFERSITWFA